MAIISASRSIKPVVARRAPTRVFANPIQIEKLPNGLTVVLVRHDSPGLIAYYTLVRVGSREEVEPGHSGFAHLFEHMMFKGTKRFPKDKRVSTLYGLGVHDTAFTWNDQTVYTLTGPTTALAGMVEIEADRFMNLTYSKEDLQTEAKTVLGEYNKNFSNPAEKMEEVMMDTAFVKHTYKHTTMGFLADIRKMLDRYDYSRKFFQRFYRPDRCIIFLVGDLAGDSDASRAVRLIREHYGSWSGRSAQPKIEKEPPQKGAYRKQIAWETPTKARLMVGYHTPSLEGDYTASAVQNVLGPLLFGQSSPLYKDLVLGRQLAESMDSWYADTRDPRLFYFVITAKRRDALPAIERAVFGAIDEIVRGTLSPKRLEEVKSNVRYGLTMALETPGKIAYYLSLLSTPTGDPETLNKLYDRIARLTVRDLAAFARTHLTAQNRTVVTLTGKEAKKAAKAKKGGKRE